MFDRKFVAMALASVAVAGTLTACNNDGKSGESSTASTKATTSSSAGQNGHTAVHNLGTRHGELRTDGSTV